MVPHDCINNQMNGEKIGEITKENKDLNSSHTGSPWSITILYIFIVLFNAVIFNSTWYLHIMAFVPCTGERSVSLPT